MKSSRQYRNSHGQALAEGAAALILLTAIIVGGVLLILGTGTLAYYKIKLATVTSAVAKVAVDGRYWLGAQRPDFNATTVQNNATTLATDLLGKAGFPSQVISSATVTVDFASDPNAAIVTIAVSYLPIVSGGILPSVASMQDTEAEPYILNRPIGVLRAGYQNMSGGTSDVVAGVNVPCYGTDVSSSILAGPSAYPDKSLFNFPVWCGTAYNGMPSATPMKGPEQNGYTITGSHIPDDTSTHPADSTSWTSY